MPARSTARRAASTASVPAGRTPPTAALARALDRLGVQDPVSGQPFSEAMLFGLGGGLGASYVVLEYRTYVGLQLAGLNLPKRDLAETAARRLGLDVSVRTSPTPAAAEKALRAALATGRPVIVTVDQSFLPLHWVPREVAGTTPHPVLVSEEGGEPLVTDLGPHSFRWSWAELAAARSRVRSARARLVVVGPPRQPIDLAPAIRAGLAEIVEGMLRPADDGTGLPALEKWARLMRSRTEERRWEALFAEPIRLVSALTWIDHFTQSAGTGGGNYRPLMADFLDEAAVVLGDEHLWPIAAQYRALAGCWTAFVHAALPDRVPELRRLREAAARKKQLLSEVGGPAAARLGELAVTRWNVFPKIVAEGLPSLGDVRVFLDGLADHLDGLVAAERRAVEGLASISGASGA